jgi:hypothetical protein
MLQCVILPVLFLLYVYILTCVIVILREIMVETV